MKKLFFVICLAGFLGLALAAAGQAVDGKALYNAKCQGCHGADGTKRPLKVGEPLKGMSAEAVGKAMHGYKAKSFGGEKKAIMEQLVAPLSDAEIDALAQYVSTL